MTSPTTPPLEALAGYPVIITIPVAWGDMDAAQHVNNTVYFRYFESARIAYFERIAFGLDFAQSVGPIVAHTQCRFRWPLTYPDTISVGTGVSGLGDDRFVMRFTIASHRHGKVAAQGDGLIVSYDYRNQRKAPLPAAVRAAIMTLERFDPTAPPSLPTT
ncbi:MAG: thioesterase family protein [Chloracidobacterium sp.]|uniref:Acyl-CoA thioesterase n=1 Tax=Chloracidobacterium validum TaxID=2821543 RepID=A0ABX8B8T4_9BACT|nr:thioesterase family protein [Chloracidobacterium validum]QUW02023.1 acyl-CoA thioesterase [Chloracidobacterium validum]